MATFIEQNPNAVDYDIIYEGSKLNLSADDELLLINLSIAHPVLQMRFLMQKASLYIDPSGKKKRNYEITLPCALDVKDQLETDMPQPSDGKKSQDARPDIRPLIGALNQRGANYHHNSTDAHLGFQYFHIEHDRQNELLNYYILIPKEPLMQDKKLSDEWALGIVSVNDQANMPPPEQDGEGRMAPPPMEGEDEQALQELMQSDIREWIKFSIDDVNNANLKE